ncbi:hypothetical protein BI364_14380 [Acidihalobacter yilgarnensis]|uniref:Uncharacterized protein n=1 Tax=Acidihalobacter yilgarnensis TaxID=2819280 RepID=A0A1D8ITB2_9GAMM|nr:PP0621 family protein [Acidihalobacter yilgarnensis]AOU99762.1 hypothetical protein BI364_14380 [Acidihalobacter yilgarnensis]
MSRLLFLLALAAVAYYFYRSFVKRLPKQPTRPPMRKLDTVRCERCGVHLPADEAVAYHDRHYCSVEHLEDDRSGNR